MRIHDHWTALQFDNAVCLVGTVIENAAQEMVKVGTDDKAEYKPKYKLSELLDENFRLPNPNAIEPLSSFENQLGGIHGLIIDEV